VQDQIRIRAVVVDVAAPATQAVAQLFARVDACVGGDEQAAVEARGRSLALGLTFLRTKIGWGDAVSD